MIISSLKLIRNVLCERSLTVSLRVLLRSLCLRENSPF